MNTASERRKGRHLMRIWPLLSKAQGPGSLKWLMNSLKMSLHCRLTCEHLGKRRVCHHLTLHALLRVTCPQLDGTYPSIDHLDPNLLSSTILPLPPISPKRHIVSLRTLIQRRAQILDKKVLLTTSRKVPSKSPVLMNWAQSFALATTSLLPSAEIPIERHGWMYVSSTSTP